MPGMASSLIPISVLAGRASPKNSLRAGTKRKYNHVIEPLAISEKEGRTVLRAKLAGDFPGSPIELDFRFLLEQGKIASLDIG
jgi:hypothetical protein